jgi:hypothetical protein
MRFTIIDECEHGLAHGLGAALLSDGLPRAAMLN